MIDYFKKWYNRTWSNWYIDYESDWKIIIRRTSNDGLIEIKRIRK